MNSSQGCCVIECKIALLCTQIIQKGNLLNKEEVCHKIYLWIIYQKTGEVSKQQMNTLKQEFSTGSDSAPQGTVSNV